MTISKTAAISKTASKFLGLYLILTFAIALVVIKSGSLVDIKFIAKTISYMAVITVFSIFIVCVCDPDVTSQY